MPVLAARQTGNAHAFDFAEPLGRLLWFGIKSLLSPSHDESSADTEFLEEAGAGELAGALERRGIYRQIGIADDDISSQAIVYAPGLFHDAEERVLTLRQVERLEVAEAAGCPAIFAVENPAVFAAFLDRMGALHPKKPGNAPVLVCVNGQPSAATIRLLDLFLNHDPVGEVLPLYYAGDFDVKGLEIAAGLLRRYSNHFIPWRMSAVDYERAAVQGTVFNAEEQERLRRMRVSWDSELIPVMLGRGLKLHQELLLEPLWEDWVSGCRG